MNRVEFLKQYEGENKGHPYHLVPLSPWPLVGALSALILTIGGALYMHNQGASVFYIGGFLLVFTLVGWWRDVIKEAKKGNHNEIVKYGLRSGMGLFIASEIMFFVAFFWAFFDSSFFPGSAIGGVWPPKDIVPLDPFTFPYVNTLILLLSATSLTWAHDAVLRHHNKDVVLGLLITIVLGAVFTCVQAYEYAHASFTMDQNIYGSVFYMLTGFHGAHVIIGTIFLIVCYFRARKEAFTPKVHVGFEAAAWYWHFVDVVWLFLFVFLYWWGS